MVMLLELFYCRFFMFVVSWVRFFCLLRMVVVLVMLGVS